ncbi:MAG: type II/IV secretion system protein [Gammaproteobacteria bacterium]|nr:type II/IV secretion system protein [Gammaproteobacteria bacterium]
MSLLKSFDLDSILDCLVESGVADVDKAKMVSNLVSVKDREALHPFQIISNRNWENLKKPGQAITSSFLTDWLSEIVDLPRFRFDPLKMDVAACTSLMTYAYASRFKILVVRVTAAKVYIGVSDPINLDWMNELSHIISKPIKIVLCDPAEIKKYSLEFYSVTKAMDGAGIKHADSIRNNIQNFEQLVELGKTGKFDADDQHIVSIVDWLLQFAFEQRASDIHFEPRRDQGNVRFRIDGVLHHVYEIPSNIIPAVSSRIKILGRLDVAEKRKPQDGRIKTRSPEGLEIELRVSTMPTAFGEKIVLRIFDPEVLVKDAKALGFEKSESDLWDSLIHQPHGIILVTGPTGSGKTTTLYTSLKQLATADVNVCSIEDPIELVEPSFNQMQVNPAIDLDFSFGVKTLLRQDPDIIMIGEIRDKETAEMAVQAALTGHLVLSTLHTNDAPSAVARLIEIGIPPYLINATLIGVVAQRLVRTLCPSCKQPTKVDKAAWDALIKPWKTEPPEMVYEPVGCLECRETGFKGRVGVYEMMTVSNPMKSVIQDNFDLRNLRKVAIKNGMKALNLSGAKKIAKGVTTFEEVLKVAPPRFDG